MRSAAKTTLLAGCMLVVGIWLLSKPRVELGPVTGEVIAVGDGEVTLGVEPGQVSTWAMLRGRQRRVSIAPVLAAQLQVGDRIQGEVMSAPKGGRAIGTLRFLRRAVSKPVLDSDRLPIGATLPARTIPGIDGSIVLGAGQGTPTVLAFFYTSCGIPTACPMLAQKLVQLQGELRGHGRIVTLTLDPEVDTLATLRAYAQQHQAVRDTWLLGRLELAQLEPLLRQIGVARVRIGGNIVHGLQLVLLDGEGRLVWRSDGSGWDVSDLAERLRKLSLKEGRNT